MNQYFKISLLLLGIICSLFSCNRINMASAQRSIPLLGIHAPLLSANPFTYSFAATASDADNNPLKFNGSSGEGTIKEGSTQESFIYPANEEYPVKKMVTNGKLPPVETNTHITIAKDTVTVNSGPQHALILKIPMKMLILL